jgi:hypothetical protein
MLQDGGAKKIIKNGQLTTQKVKVTEGLQRQGDQEVNILFYNLMKTEILCILLILFTVSFVGNDNLFHVTHLW